MSYSQGDEETVILRHFGEKHDGRALDIGAYNGRLFSNTLALFELGWSGVCVEPSPRPFVDLLSLHSERPNVTVINAAIGETPGLMKFYDSGGDAVSTLDESHREKWQSSAKFTQMVVSVVTIRDLLDYVGRQWDFLSLDVEGKSAGMMLSFPLHECPALSCVVVEHDNKLPALRDFMDGHGFREEFVNAENVIFLR